MKAYRIEILTALFMALIFAALCIWQAPGRPMTRAEVDSYMAKLDATFPFDETERADLLKRMRQFGENDDGQPVYMVNLLRYFDHVRLGHGIPANYKGTPAEANAYYETKAFKIALGAGSYPIFAGSVSGANVIGGDPAEDNWSRVAVMRYPSRRAFFQLVTDPRYTPIVRYKLDALHVGLVPSRAEIAIPDARLAFAAASLILLLALGWFRAARRASGK